MLGCRVWVLAGRQARNNCPATIHPFSQLVSVDRGETVDRQGKCSSVLCIEG